MTINWDELSDSSIIYIEPKLAKELITEGIRRSGSKRQLVKSVLSYSGASPDVTFLGKVMDGKRGIAKFRLERLLSFLNTKPKTIEDKLRIRSKKH